MRSVLSLIEEINKGFVMEWFEELKRRGVYKATAVYTVVAWSLIQAIGVIAPIFNAPQWLNQTLVLILLLGFPVVLALSWMFEISSGGLRRSSSKSNSPSSSVSIKDYLVAGTISVLVLLVVGQQVLLLSRANTFESETLASSQVSEGIAQILQFIDEERFLDAFTLASSLEKDQPNNTVLQELWSEFSAVGSVISEPQGAEVWISDYFSTSGEMILLGTTPLQDVRIPRGIFRIQLRKEGFLPRTTLGSNPYYSFGNYPPYPNIPPIPIKLLSNSDSEDLLPVSNIKIGLGVYGFSNNGLELGEYEIGKFEVTNEQFKQFVDDGGYETPAFWEDLDFESNGVEISFEEVLQFFVDTTGRNAPAGWELGSYPLAEGKNPVTGISWYEAVAYSRYRGLSLPTAYHWSRAGLLNAYFRTPKDYSNFSGEILPANDESAIGPFGAFNMLGNVREWVWNTKGENKLVLGGSFADPDYMSTLAYELPPLTRDPFTGFRVAAYIDPAIDLEPFLEPPDLAFTDFRDAQPASIEVFEAIRDQFSYSSENLSPEHESTDESNPIWDLEIVSINTDYDDDRVRIHLFKPKDQTRSDPVIHVSGLSTFSAGAQMVSPKPLDFDFIISSGRTLIILELDGSYSRYDGLSQLSGDALMRKRSSQLLNWHSDLGRSIDYLSTREDLNMNALSYIGASFGASIVTPLLALEERFTSAVLFIGGFSSANVLTLSDQLTHVAQITLPTLMVNGTSDNIFPQVTSAIPFYEKLGTPQDSKKIIFFDGGHEAPPRAMLVRETVSWLDRF